ncbi:MAG: PAS domain S-box protein, partial [Bacteroidota bacterium]|nr:PAS domain S-box protein [Bacteroidota bacterium]
LITAEGQFLKWNSNFENATGYSTHEVYDLYPFDLFGEEEKELMAKKVAHVFEVGEDSVEANFLLKDGTRKFYYLTGKAVEYEGKKCLIGVGLDLSERRAAEEVVERNEAKLSALVQQAADGITIVDETYRFVEVNRKFCEMVGYSKEELLQMKVTELPIMGPGDPALKFDEIKGGHTVLTERNFKRKDGTLVTVEISASMIQGQYFLSFIRDITERKRTSKLMEGERKIMEMIATGQPLKEILDEIVINYETICNHSVCSILLMDPERRTLSFCAAPHLPVACSEIDPQTLTPAPGQDPETGPLQKEQIRIIDIAQNPEWTRYRVKILKEGLLACWTAPICDVKGSVLGSFAIFRRQAGSPASEELLLMDRASNLVKIALERNKSALELQKREEKFRTMIESISDAFVAVDHHWKYTYVNQNAGSLFGKEPSQLIGKHLFLEFPDSAGKSFRQACQKALREQKPVSFSEFYPPFNRWLENSIYPSGEGISIYFRDVTRQKQAEQKIIKSSRLYYFISQFNQMIIHAGNETSLFRQACDIAVNVGNFNLAWIGILNPDTGRLEPMMYSGYQTDYVSYLNISVEEGSIEAKGPSGQAISMGKTICSNDIENDPKMAPWKQEALRRNYRSSIGLPIRKFKKVIGVFNLYSDTKNFFDEEEISLLEKVTGDISFALEIYENEALKQKADEEIIRSNRQFQNLVESISGVYWVNDLSNYQTLYISPSYEKIWGRSCEDLYRNPSDFINSIHPEDRETIIEAHRNIGSSSMAQVNYRIIRPNGEVRWISAKTNVVTDQDGKQREYGYAEDITERKMAEANLLESENRLKTILDNEPECVKLLNEKGELLEMNPAGLTMLEADSLEKVRGARVSSMLKEPYRSRFEAMIKNVFEGRDEKMEFEITGLKGTHRWMETSAVPLRDAQGKIVSMLSVTRDISDRKNAEEVEKQLTQKVLKGAEIARFGFIDWDLESNQVSLSQKVNEIYGIPEETLDCGEFIKSVVHPDDKGYVDEQLQMAIRGYKEYNIDHRIIDGSGNVVWINARAELIRDTEGKPVRMFGTVLDITETKNAELQIKAYNERLRQLTAHLQRIREEERKRIGREIHDELGQQLTAIKMDIAWIEKHVENPQPAVRTKLRNMIELLDGSNQSVRKILNELRPTILDNNGLVEAMEYHARQFTSSTYIPVLFRYVDQDMELNEQTSTCIFRVFQESLTNIMKYAQATEVRISIAIKFGKVLVAIEDDGIGFDLREIDTKNTFGIIGMRERVRAMGGDFEVESKPGKGTRISIILPHQKFPIT